MLVFFDHMFQTPNSFFLPHVMFCYEHPCITDGLMDESDFASDAPLYYGNFAPAKPLD